MKIVLCIQKLGNFLFEPENVRLILNHFILVLNKVSIVLNLFIKYCYFGLNGFTIRLQKFHAQSEKSIGPFLDILDIRVNMAVVKEGGSFLHKNINR